MSDENKENEQLTPEQQADKETKKYLHVMSLIKDVVGGEKNLLPVKRVSGDTTAEIVADLFKEENAELQKKVKEGLKNLLKQHVQLTSDIASKKKELEKLESEKRKEFTKAANEWLKQIDTTVLQTEAYTTALQTAFKKEEE